MKTFTAIYAAAIISTMSCGIASAACNVSVQTVGSLTTVTLVASDQEDDEPCTWSSPYTPSDPSPPGPSVLGAALLAGSSTQVLFTATEALIDEGTDIASCDTTGTQSCAASAEEDPSEINGRSCGIDGELQGLTTAIAICTFGYEI